MTSALRLLAVGILLIVGFQFAEAQDIRTDSLATDSIERAIDSILKETPVAPESLTVDLSEKALRKQKAPKRDWATWTPDPKRAMWLALVIPGGGQMYNRKYWKLPIIYGGFVGCAYAMNWNNMMYKEYSQFYLDIADEDPGTASYNKILHFGRQIDDTNKDRYKEIFRKRKDKFRRWRDMSFFVMVGVYAISVIDAYVDAELSVFDISKDLSLRVEPTIINRDPAATTIHHSSVGLQCSLSF